MSLQACDVMRAEACGSARFTTRLQRERFAHRLALKEDTSYETVTAVTHRRDSKGTALGGGQRRPLSLRVSWDHGHWWGKGSVKTLTPVFALL